MAAALERRTGPREGDGVLEEEPGDALVQPPGRLVAAGQGPQGVQAGGVALVDQGPLGVVRQPLTVDIPQIEDVEPGQALVVDQCAQRVGIRVDVMVGHLDEVAEDMSVRADDHPGPGRVVSRDAGAERVQEAQRQPFALVGEAAQHLGRVGRLAGEARQGEHDRLARRHRCGELPQLGGEAVGGVPVAGVQGAPVGQKRGEHLGTAGEVVGGRHRTRWRRAGQHAASGPFAPEPVYGQLP